MPAPPLTDRERKRLGSLARLVPSLTPPGDVDALVAGLATAALAEYVAHLTLQPPITTIGALRELRLAVLSEHLFAGALPGEAFVAELFSLTATEARSLLRRSVARQPERMADALCADARRSIEQAVPVGKAKKPKDYILSADRTVIALLADLVAQSPDHPPRITARPDATGRYDLHTTTRDSLLAALRGSP